MSNTGQKKQQQGVGWGTWLAGIVVGLFLIRNCSNSDSGTYNGRSDFYNRLESINPGDHYVNPYMRSNGTTVEGHWRTNPDGTTLNNYNGPYGDDYRKLNGH